MEALRYGLIGHEHEILIAFFVRSINITLTLITTALTLATFFLQQFRKGAELRSERLAFAELRCRVVLFGRVVLSSRPLPAGGRPARMSLSADATVLTL